MTTPERTMDLKLSMTFVFAYPHGECQPEIICWFVERGMPPHMIQKVKAFDIISARNTAAALALRSGCQWFFFVDDDIIPGPNTDPILCATEDVVGAVAEPLPNTAYLADPTVFHCGFLRMNRRALQDVKPPWFDFERSEDGTQIIKCECRYFRDKVLEAGLTCGRRGLVEHVA